MPSPLHRKPPPPPHVGAAGRSPGPCQEAWPGDVPAAGALGQVNTVVVSSPAAAQEVLQDSNVNFESRPTMLAGHIMGYEHTDIVFAPYGPYWRMLRKLCTVELLSSRKVRRFAPIRHSETMSLVRDVSATSSGAKPVNLATLLQSCANSITAKATFGVVADPKIQEQFLSAMKVGLSLADGFCVGDLFPCLWFVDVLTGLNRKLWHARRQVDAMFVTIIAECQVRREEKKKKMTTTTDDDDLLSILLRMKEEGELEIHITTTNMKAIVLDLFAAGTDTASTSIEWIMSELMRNPEVMAKAQLEVRRTFHDKRPQDHEAHLEELHYTKMVVKEGLRLHPPVPLLIPRVCRETCDIGGFMVVEGSRIMVNAWAIARDPKCWNDAEEFKPERFSDSKVDYKGTQFEYLPFGSGRRACPGSNFGLAVLELILARLLYYFDWSLPAGIQPNELDMDMIVGATSKRRNPLNLKLIEF